MHFCCQPEPEEQQLPNLKSSSTKPKFSFRSLTASQSYSHLDLSTSNNQKQIEQLEREYQMLLEQQKVTNEFETNRVGTLQREVTFYEGQIRERERQYQQLSQLYKQKLQERSQMERQEVIVFKRQKNIDEVSSGTTHP